ncbi:hypothetical protein BT63DRAFT_452278 [Microthyrium microscopicum]|uniref:Mitochondrial outer membrane transport complex Sam37/metaxin N-terminal domain-containing protein n=1 Tax=Microthyrium microscopicum TaxID=703497 RepID=A0A6A6ULJ5_9PEZI|nr:hypothetical protein BT63DRAFT_452278 [Microthyrium microscopicum]
MTSRLNLKIWPSGDGFPFPSLNVDCLAAIAYFQLLWRTTDNAVNWTIISDWDASQSPNGQFPVLSCSCEKEIAGILNIFQHVGSCDSINGHSDLNSWMNEDELADCTAWSSHVLTLGTQLLDLYLFITYENYYSTTRPAYTAFLPLYANYTIPPAHQKAAEKRTEHLGLATILGEIDDEPRMQPISLRTGGVDPSASASASFTEKIGFGNRKEILSKAQKRMRLESIVARFLEPLEELLGKKRYFLSNKSPSSLDALVLAYLSLILEVKVPDRWAAEIVENSKLTDWIKREAPHIYGNAPNKG